MKAWLVRNAMFAWGLVFGQAVLIVLAIISKHS
jgi:hypothetical protein